MKNNNGKNAFEIRLDILEMANAASTNLFYEKLNILKEEDEREYNKAIRHAEKRNTSVVLPKNIVDADKIDELTPKTADIIARARELYSFVEGS